MLGRVCVWLVERLRDDLGVAGLERDVSALLHGQVALAERLDDLDARISEFDVRGVTP